MKTKEVSFEELKDILDDNFFLIITATDIEAEATRTFIKPLPDFTEVLICIKGISFLIGTFAKYKVVYVQCDMGGTGFRGSSSTLQLIFNHLSPLLVLMPGIAFGVNEKDQNIGDVIIADRAYPYELKKIDNGTEINRADPLYADNLLIDRFKIFIPSWDHEVYGKKVKMFSCPILSGSALINDLDYRNKLLKVFTQAKGGEMEGYGVYAACHQRTPALLVKGICDYADGNKDYDKDERQRIAVNASLNACHFVFSSKHAFVELGLSPVKTVTEIEEINNLPDNEVIKNILSSIQTTQDMSNNSEITVLINSFMSLSLVDKIKVSKVINAYDENFIKMIPQDIEVEIYKFVIDNSLQFEFWNAINSIKPINLPNPFSKTTI